MNRTLLLAASACLAVAVSACGEDPPDTVRLIAYDSFPTDEGGPVARALDEFTADTGITVELIIADDTGAMLSSAALTAGNPEADVMWGIDNTFLARAIDADIFEPYEANGLQDLPDELTALVPGNQATPVDFGDVCLNYDIASLSRAGVPPPTSLSDLTGPDYTGRLVVQNPATSSPGFAFLLATIAEFGEEGWEQYWRDLRANDVDVVDSWSDAYYARFTRFGGDRPIVVSYGSSPPFEVLGAEPQLTEAASGVVAASCFRQVEFAGILRGTDVSGSAGQLIDFLISERFQREVALNLFVFPANTQVELESTFVEFATIPDDPIEIDPRLIEDNRTDWIERWNSAVIR